MTTAPKDAAKLAVLKPAETKAKAQAQAALDQMFGYFSFEPMPSERSDARLAA